MEELLARVDRLSARDYMSEALRCYHASAFRACVVLSYIALFDDLRAKLASLASVNKQARVIHDEIEKKAKDQEIYETYLADQLAAARVIDAAQKLNLDLIIKLRNKAAHPSGVHASAEEARHVFFETIDKFLSKPALQATAAVDAIIDALAQGNFFPTNQINDVQSIVETEISALHDQAVPYLIQKLVEGYEAHGSVRPPARSFLSGLAALKDPRIRSELQKRIVIGKGQSKDYASVIVSLLRVDPELATGLDPVPLKRISALLKVLIISAATSEKVNRLANPLGWLAAFVRARGQVGVWQDYQSVVEALNRKYLYDPELMKVVADKGPIQEAYFELFLERARSTQFDTANPAAKAVSELSESLGAQISSEKAFRVLAAVTKAAEYNAFDALSLRDSNFSQAKELRKLAAKFGTVWAVKAQGILKEYGVAASLKGVMQTLT
jgi:hypothetical protein